jgi:hypothetical protein
LICSRKTHFVVSPIVMRRWSKFLKKKSRLWGCQGIYFTTSIPNYSAKKH